jgi:hypothetical protein
MHPWRWLPLALLGVACVDLGRPPELMRPPVTLNDAGEPVDVGGSGDDAATGRPDSAGSPPDAAAVPPDAAPPVDAPPAPAPDAAVPTDTEPLPDLARDLAPVPADAAAAPDAAVTPDASLPPDLAPDVAPDLAPDLAPDVAPDLAPDVAPDVSPDVGPPALVIDDFQTATPPKNNLGSEFTTDNQICNRVDGEMVCAYDGTGSYQDFIEPLNNWCAFQGGTYRRFRFRMRSSVAGQSVDVYVGTNTGSCVRQTNVKIGTIVTTAAMTTYELDFSAVAAGRGLVLFELDPLSTSATTQFIFDDLQLVP